MKPQICNMAFQILLIWSLDVTFKPFVTTYLNFSPLCLCSHAVSSTCNHSHSTPFTKPYPSIEPQPNYYILSELFSQSKIIFSKDSALAWLDMLVIAFLLVFKHFTWSIKINLHLGQTLCLFYNYLYVPYLNSSSF